MPKLTTKTPLPLQRQLSRQPELRFNPRAWAKLLYLRDYGETEVGGFALVDADDLLYVEDVLLVRQRCSLVSVAFDDDPVADLVAQAEYVRRGGAIRWHELTPRARKRQRNRAKRWLNTLAADRMTVERLAERDPDGEVRGWLATIARLQACNP